MHKPKIDLDLSKWFKDNGEAPTGPKELVVLHETISHDSKGVSDMAGVAAFLDKNRLEIHGMTDAEGKIAWANGLRRKNFDHVTSSGSKGFGNVGVRSIGIEQISFPVGTVQQKLAVWLKRERQLFATAKLLAWISTVEPIPLRHVDSSFGSNGVTTHWDVTMRWGVVGGHTDCFPKDKGGYYPIGRVLRYAKAIKAASNGSEAAKKIVRRIKNRF